MVGLIFIAFLFPEFVCMWVMWASYLFLHACIFWLAGNMPIITIKPSNGPAQINTPQDNYRWLPSGDGLWNHHLKWCIVAPPQDRYELKQLILAKAQISDQCTHATVNWTRNFDFQKINTCSIWENCNCRTRNNRLRNYRTLDIDFSKNNL